MRAWLGRPWGWGGGFGMGIPIGPTTITVEQLLIDIIDAKLEN